MNRLISNGSRRARMDELDAWVLEELEALGSRTRPRAADATKRAPPAAERLPPDQWGNPRMENEGAFTGDVGELFDEDVSAFIKRSAAWLAGRPNADMILEELWRLAIPSADEKGATYEVPELSSDKAEPPLPLPDQDDAGDLANAG
jgi:hypothetical protein